jgi:hypothetical protein
MGLAPLIYDRPQIVPVMNLVNGRGYSWIGPFEYEEMLYATGKSPTRYHVLLPGVGRSPDMQQEMLSEFRANKPDAVWFNKNFYILGYQASDYGKFFGDFLREEYTTLYEYRDTGPAYASVAPVTERVDIESMLYIRKDKVEAVIAKLEKAGYIKPQ